MLGFKSRVPEFEKKVPASALVLYKREASWLIAAMIILCLFSFLAGYFLGQRKEAKSFMQQVHADAFVDQANSAIYSMQTEQKDQGSDASPAIQEKKDKETEKSGQQNLTYYAPLLTTDFYANALNVLEKAHAQGIELRIKKTLRTLRKARNKRKVTYQIVTGYYQNKQDLEKDVTILKEIYELKGISPRILEHS